jgi:putative addiction module CopG family antidote
LPSFFPARACALAFLLEALAFILLMCYPKTMTVTLPTQLETWVSSQVQDGTYADTNEVLVEALKLLKMRVALEKQSDFLSEDNQRRAALRELVQQGQEQNLGY